MSHFSPKSDGRDLSSPVILNSTSSRKWMDSWEGGHAVRGWMRFLNSQTFTNARRRVSEETSHHPSAWKGFAWNEIWVLPILSRRSNANTPILSMWQQKHTPRIISIPCLGHGGSEEAVGFMSEWRASGASLDNWGGGQARAGDSCLKWKIRDDKYDEKERESSDTRKADSVQRPEAMTSWRIEAASTNDDSR